MPSAAQSASGDQRLAAPAGSRPVIRVAFIVIVLVSAVPAIGLAELTGEAPGWLFPGQIGVLAALLLAGFVRPAYR